MGLTLLSGLEEKHINTIAELMNDTGANHLRIDLESDMVDDDIVINFDRVKREFAYSPHIIVMESHQVTTIKIKEDSTLSTVKKEHEGKE